MAVAYDHDFMDKVVVVTGGGGVLCSLLAKEAARLGAKIALMDIGSGSAEKVVDEIVTAGGTAKAYTANVLDAASLEAALADIERDYGPVDILLNGAGGNRATANTDDEFFSVDSPKTAKTFFDLPQDALDGVLSLNLMGTLLPCQVFCRSMAERGSGCVVNMSSMNAFTPLTKIPAYSAVKAAVTNFTQWLATYLAPAGVRVNAIAPGFFSTAQNASLLFNEDGTPTQRSEKILAGTPMNRFGTPKDLVGAFLFLADDQASAFVTGVTLPVDGGFSAYSGV